MEFAPYIRIFKNWLWLILSAALVGSGISFILSSQQVPYYTAQTTISIGQYIQDPNPTSTQIYIGQNLVATYQQLVKTRDVLQGVADELKLNMTPDYIGGLVTTSVVENTSLMIIKVRYIDPILTADLANAVADQLIAHSPTNLTDDQKNTVDFANAQIKALSDQVTQERAQNAQIDQQLLTTTDAAQIASLNQQKSNIVTQINQATATIAQFQLTITSLQQKTNAISIVDKAVVPTSPSGSDSGLKILVGGAAGAALAIGLVLLLDYLDDKIRTSEAATQVLALSVLGTIPQFGKKNAPSKDHLISNFELLSEVAESYRRLRTNLVFPGNQDSQNVFIVTSSGPSEGKSVTAANLAVTLASAGMRVLLIDADLRRPSQHEIFGLENSVGLTTLLLVDPNKVNTTVGAAAGAANGNREEFEDKIPRKLDQCLQTTPIANLKVVTSGFVPSNPAEILGSTLMKRWIEAFRNSSNTDIILIDTPPTLMFSDSSILAGLVAGDILMVIDSSKTHRNAAIQAREQLQQTGAEIRGVILNRVNPRDELSYYSDNYTGYYYTPGKDRPKRGLLRWFGR